MDRWRARFRAGSGLAGLLAVCWIATPWLATPCLGAANFGAAFLDNGLGVRAQGMAGAFAAVADDASAVFWNPAGLARARGKDALLSGQWLSLDRTQASVAASTNSRGGLGFGFAWIYAGVNHLDARTGSGDVFGEIDDSENAVFFAVGLPLIGNLAAGAAVKLIWQTLDVPQLGASTANGRAVDLGLQYRIGSTRLGATVKNLAGQLDWTVRRSALQSNKTREDLPLTLTLGGAHRVMANLLVAADVQTNDIDTYANAGVEYRISPMLTMRGGIRGVGGKEGGGGSAFGVTLRPMQEDTVLFNLTIVTDDVDAGSRTLAGLSLHF